MPITVRENIFIRTNNHVENRSSIWFIHGFADSGLAYKKVFESDLAEKYNLYLIDLPGFGVSPINPSYLTIKEQADLVTKIIKGESASSQKVCIIAHSLGALIGTWVCTNLPEKISYYFNIEGNLTTTDSYFSSKPIKYTSAAAFAISFEKEIFEKAKTNPIYRHYYSSFRFANPEGMRNWAFTSQEYIKENQCGFAFKNLPCNKVYIWGDVDTPIETQKFIHENQIPNQLFKGIGHWHMLENARNLYGYISEKLAH